MRGVIEITPGAAPIDTRDPSNGIHADPFHPRKIDDQASLAGSKARNAVAAAPHGGSQTFFPGEVDTVDHVGNIGALDDQPRAAVDHRVVDSAGGVERRIGWTNRLAAQARKKSFHGPFGGARRSWCSQRYSHVVPLQKLSDSNFARSGFRSQGSRMMFTGYREVGATGETVCPTRTIPVGSWGRLWLCGGEGGCR